MELVKPAIGLVFWMVITFGALFFILAKFAWKPILGMLNEREKTIADSLEQANKARAEMAALTSKNQDLLNQAKEERNAILHEAKEAADKLKNEMLAKARKRLKQKFKPLSAKLKFRRRLLLQR